MLRKFSLICFFVAGLTWNFSLYRTFSLPDVTPLKYEAPGITAFMSRYLWHHPIGFRDFQLFWTPDAKIAAALKRAVVAAEDDEFYSHPGFSWSAIKRAMAENWRRRRIVRGASTITQQLAKNLYLSKARTPSRKLKEFLIALKLERELSKERILEIYLNVVEWGPGIFGCEAAARYYFQGSCSGLSAGQAAFLASILPNPIRLGKGGYRLNHRAQQILRIM